MGAVNTTYTFTATDTITSTKMNNIIDETVMTTDAVLSSGGLEIASGKLAISANAINSSRLAANSVSSSNIVDGTIVNADISPTAAIAGTKIVSNFGTQGITATGNLGLYGSSSNYTAAALVNTSGVETQLYSSGNTNGGISTITNHPLTLSTNNAERMRITAAGDVGIGTSSPINYANYTTQTIYGTNGGVVSLGSSNANRAELSYTPNFLELKSVDAKPLILGTNNLDRITILSAGNVGIGTSNPKSGLHVYGSGQLTANITDSGNENAFLRVSDSSTAAGSGGGIIFASSQSDDTGAVGMAAIKGLLVDGGTNTSGDLAFSTRNSSSDTALTERMRIEAAGNVGIGKTNPNTILDVNGTVTATAFAGPLTGNVTGSASNVNNGVITAPKLSGAQTGTAPVYGIRAYARVQGNGTVDINKGFSSISRGGNGFYDLTLTTAPSAGSVPAITATCHTPSGNSYNLSATVQINSSTSFTVKTGHEDIPSLNDADFSIMVIY